MGLTVGCASIMHCHFFFSFNSPALRLASQRSKVLLFFPIETERSWGSRCGLWNIAYYRAGDVREDSLRLCAPYETPLHSNPIIRREKSRSFSDVVPPLEGRILGKLVRDRARRETPFAARNNELQREGARDRCRVRDGGKILGGNVGLLYTGLFFVFHYCTHNFSDN